MKTATKSYDVNVNVGADGKHLRLRRRRTLKHCRPDAVSTGRGIKHELAA
jgi:hypothetical protein